MRKLKVETINENDFREYLSKAKERYSNMNKEDALNIMRLFVINYKSVITGTITKIELRDRILSKIEETQLSIENMTYNEMTAYLIDECWKRFVLKAKY